MCSTIDSVCLLVLVAQDIMWRHFVELGPWKKGGSGEETIADMIFRKLKSELGETGKFVKKLANGELFEVTDDVAHLSECLTRRSITLYRFEFVHFVIHLFCCMKPSCRNFERS